MVLLVVPKTDSKTTFLVIFNQGNKKSSFQLVIFPTGDLSNWQLGKKVYYCHNFSCEYYVS
jgi:hypothetical protein